MKTALSKYYLDASKPGSFAGLEKFYHGLRDEKHKPARKTIRKWLPSLKTYSLHKKSIRKFTRNKVFAYGIDYLWQIDLCDMQNIKNFNYQKKYLITVIDVFSKYAWALPLPNKNRFSVSDALKCIFSERIPKRIQTDSGTEFLNKEVDKLLEKHEIQFI